MVERFFRDISENRLRRGVFTSVLELLTAIDEYIAHHNTHPRPFIWTKSARDMLQKVIRANSRLSSKQNEALRYKLFAKPAYTTTEGRKPILNLDLAMQKKQWMKGLWDQAKQFDLPVKFAVNHPP